MLFNDKAEFLKKSTASLSELFDLLTGLPELALDSLPANTTVFVIMDMVNGFAREGALKSDRVEGLIAEITKLAKQFAKAKIATIALNDCHTNASPEFDSYPPHCLQDTSEAQLVDEIKAVGNYTIIPKNSTNGFLDEGFKKWLQDNSQLSTFVIAGNCTDICVEQFAVSLKAWYNLNNKKVRIIIPANAVETFDLGLHNGDLMHVMALYNMLNNGIEVVCSLKI